MCVESANENYLLIQFQLLALECLEVLTWKCLPGSVEWNRISWLFPSFTRQSVAQKEFTPKMVRALCRFIKIGVIFF